MSVTLHFTEEILEKAIKEKDLGAPLTKVCIFAQTALEAIPECKEAWEWGCGYTRVCFYKEGFASEEYTYVPVDMETERKVGMVSRWFDSGNYDTIRKMLPFSVEFEKVDDINDPRW